MLAVGLVGVSIAAGSRLSAVADIGSLPAAPRFDGMQLPHGGLAPLTPDFVARVLGGEATAAEPDRPRTASVRAVSDPRAPDRGRAPAPPRRHTVTHAPTNDPRAAAYEIDTLPFTARTDTSRAGREPDDPSSCAPRGGTVWYAFRPDQDMRLLASTVGSDFVAALGVFDDGGELIGCEVDGSGNAEVSFLGDGGSHYLFQVTGPVGGGDLVFNLDELGDLRVISRDPDGTVGRGDYPSISADGRRVVYADRVVDLVTERWWTYVDGVRYADGPRISGDGRHIVFSSTRGDLVADDTNGYDDLFVHDLETGRTVRASVSSEGRQGRVALSEDPAGWSSAEMPWPSQAISHDGRHVAFTSALRGLVPGDPPTCTAPPPNQSVLPSVVAAPRPVLPVSVPGARCRQAFVRDLVLGTTVRISVSSSGEVGIGNSGGIDISADGRYVAFSSDAPNLTADDGGWFRDVFVHDRDADEDGIFDEAGAVATELISRSTSGAPANGNSTPSDFPKGISISGDGRLVAYASTATDLVAGDPDARPDVYLFDRATRRTQRLTASAGPLPPVGTTYLDLAVSVSGDGRYVGFDAPVADPADARDSVDPCNLDQQPLRHAYLHDRARATTTLISLAPSGERGNGGSFAPDLSWDGRSIAFHSWAGNLDDDAESRCVTETFQGTEDVWVFLYRRPTRGMP